MERVFGIETEYGLLGRRGASRLGSSDAADRLFRPLVDAYRATNAFLGNGGRLYLDVGSHPEYATPECLTPLQAVIASRAGDEVVAGLAQAAVARAAADGEALTLRLFKNNTDSHGNSYGSHENYLVGRDLDPEVTADLLAGFLVTRQLLCGTGRLVRGNFWISQRADHLHTGYGSTTTRARPLVNSRDEPLADPARFRRLHVLAGDSNLAEPSAWLRLAATDLVLRLVEQGHTEVLQRMRLADPLAALPVVARDPRAPLARPDGSTITAIALQRELAEAVEPTPDQEPVRSAWLRVLDALAAGEPDTVADTVEWAAKRRLLAEYRDRHGLAVDDPRLAAVDLAFHQLGPDGLFARLEAHGAVRRLSTPGQVAQAVTTPPANTRAALRARLVTAARAAGLDYNVDWLGFTVHEPARSDHPATDHALTMSDPFEARSAAVEEFLARFAG